LIKEWDWMRKYFRFWFCWRIKAMQKISFKVSRECTQLIKKKLPLYIKFWLKWKDIRDELALWRRKSICEILKSIYVQLWKIWLNIIKTYLSWLRYTVLNHGKYGFRTLNLLVAALHYLIFSLLFQYCFNPINRF
jgi:hypothetical protein